SAAWDAGAAADKQIQSGDGYAQMTVADTSSYAMLGLAHTHTSTGYAELNYAIYTYASVNELAIYENGTYKGGFSGYSAGDLLKVSVEGGVVKYYKNSTLLYSSSAAPSYPLLAVADVYTPGAQVLNGLIAGTNLTSVTPWTPTPSATATSTPP